MVYVRKLGQVGENHSTSKHQNCAKWELLSVSLGCKCCISICPQNWFWKLISLEINEYKRVLFTVQCVQIKLYFIQGKLEKETPNTATTRSTSGLWEIWRKREWEHNPTISKEARIFDKQMAYWIIMRKCLKKMFGILKRLQRRTIFSQTEQKIIRNKVRCKWKWLQKRKDCQEIIL